MATTTAWKPVAWRPITSAPKVDGVKVILLVGDVAISAVWGDGEWKIGSLNSYGCGCCATTPSISKEDPEPSGWIPFPEVQQ